MLPRDPDAPPLRDYVSLYRLSAELLAVLSRDGRFETLNGAWQETLGWSAAELRERPFLELVEPEDRDGVETALRAARFSAEPLRAVSRCRRRDGSRAWVHWRAVAGAGREAVCLAGRDVTDATLARLEAAEGRGLRDLGRLARIVAHDVNNVLAIVGAAAGLLRTPDAAEAAVSLLDEIDGAVRHGASLTEMIFARYGREAEAGGGPGDLNEAVHRLDWLWSALTRGGLRIEIALAQGLRRVGVPRTELEQILLNLTLNARDAMPEGGSLRIGAEDAPDAAQTVVLTVADDGPGIPPELQPRVFEPFFTTKTRTPRGHGLGLHAVREIVVRRGGEIRLDSAPGRGTRFLLALPSAAATPA